MTKENERQTKEYDELIGRLSKNESGIVMQIREEQVRTKEVQLQMKQQQTENQSRLSIMQEAIENDRKLHLQELENMQSKHESQVKQQQDSYEKTLDDIKYFHDEEKKQ